MPLTSLRISAAELYSDVQLHSTSEAPTQVCIRSLAVQQPSSSGGEAPWAYVGGVRSVKLFLDAMVEGGMLAPEYHYPTMSHPMRNPMAPALRPACSILTLFSQRETGLYATIDPLPEPVQRPIAEAGRATSSPDQARALTKVAQGGEPPPRMHAMQVQALRRLQADQLVHVSDPSSLASQTPAPAGCNHSQGYLLYHELEVSAGIARFEQAGRLYRDLGPGVDVPLTHQLLTPQPPAAPAAPHQLVAPAVPAAPAGRRLSDAGSGYRHIFPSTPTGGCELHLPAHPNPNPNPNPSQLILP